MTAPEVLWSPPADARATSRLGGFLDRLEQEHGLELADHEAAWQWSVDHIEDLWATVWDHFCVPGKHGDVTLAEAAMPGVKWFPNAELNYAEAALQMPDEAEAIVARSQSRREVRLSGRDLRDQVARCAAGLRRLGVRRGDRVAAYLPNIPEAVVAFLATASIGAIWASCAPEFGTNAVVDRLSQIEPKVLLVVGGYRYGTKDIHRATEIREIRDALPSVHCIVEVPYLPTTVPVPSAVAWGDLLAEHKELVFARVPFDHPLYVLYSSGTTGLPKPIVHGHGGIVLEHLKAVGLYCDLGPGDRFFWFSTTGWMMWNFLVSGLLVGASIVLFDGNPGHPDLDNLWTLAEELEVTFFGVSAPFLMACRKEGLRPRDQHDLHKLRAVGSTGAPLPVDGFRWVYDAVGEHVMLSSISGGTDVCTAFVGGSPMTEVRAG
ncbi:MAG: acetoacetyl-CoA synthetase, partial [Glaciecola sp.]